MIDIHSHVIFGVDDGAKNLEQSINIIKEEIDNGVTDLICTPHYRLGMFNSSIEDINENFNLLKEEVKKLNLNINLCLGREVYFDKSVYKNLDCFKTNNNNVILLEFSYHEDPDVDEILYNLTRLGYIVIIAHVERYSYLKLDDYKRLKDKNIFFQVNASTIVGKSGFKNKRLAFKLIKDNLIDFISSDIHYNRNNFLKQSYDVIYKKFGKEIANKLFQTNAEFLIK